MSKSGRGGERKPGPGKQLGAPRKDPAARTIVKGPYRFPPDVVAILGKQRNATKFLSEAARAAVGGLADLELRVAIANCRCGQDYVIVNDFGICPSGCKREAAKVGEGESLTISPDET